MIHSLISPQDLLRSDVVDRGLELARTTMTSCVIGFLAGLFCTARRYFAHTPQPLDQLKVHRTHLPLETLNKFQLTSKMAAISSPTTSTLPTRSATTATRSSTLSDEDAVPGEDTSEVGLPSAWGDSGY